MDNKRFSLVYLILTSELATISQSKLADVIKCLKLRKCWKSGIIYLSETEISSICRGKLLNFKFDLYHIIKH